MTAPLLGPIGPDEMRAAQIISGTAMALWLAVGYVPGLRTQVTRVRGVILAAYLLACAAALGYLLVR